MAVTQNVLSEHRLYTAEDMERLRGVSYLLTRRLIKCGELKEVKPEKFLARDFVDCIKNMGDYVPVYEIIRQMAEYEGTEDARELTLNITAREQQLVRQLQSAKELPLYVTMLGDSGNPLYLVEKGHVKDFKTLLASKAFYMRKSRKPTGQENIPKAEQMTIEKVIKE